MIGKVRMIYPSGTFLVWFADQGFSARGYPDRLDAPAELIEGAEYEFTLSEGMGGEVIHVGRLVAGPVREAAQSGADGPAVTETDPLRRWAAIAGR